MNSRFLNRLALNTVNASKKIVLKNYSNGKIRFAEKVEAVSATSQDLVLNFTTPHQPIYSKKVIDKIMLPGESGEYGVTANHSPVISQLAPGVVTVIHLDVSCKYQVIITIFILILG